MKKIYTIVVSNVGEVFNSESIIETRLMFGVYKDDAQNQNGHIAGESVSLLANGQRIAHYIGSIENIQPFDSIDRG